MMKITFSCNVFDPTGGKLMNIGVDFLLGIVVTQQELIIVSTLIEQ